MPGKEKQVNNKLCWHHFLFLALSFFLVALGQPAWISWIGLISAVVGYALFFRVLIDIPVAKKRFWLATLWYGSIQAFQLSWMLSHPYYYIYAIHFSASLFLGLQCGFFALFVKKENIYKLHRIVALAAMWTLLEWSRFFILSGFSWNPAGLALTGSLYALQTASILGVFGLSFWVILVNLCALRAWLKLPKIIPSVFFVSLAIAPYIFGIIHLQIHDKKFVSTQEPLHALLIQPAFPSEEALQFDSKASYVAYVIDEWRQILKIIAKHQDKKFDLIALPEYVVPFGTYNFLYPYEHVKRSFEDSFGPSSVSKLPEREEPFARRYGKVWLVNNAFWAQAIANIFNSEVIVGLEDADQHADGNLSFYSAAIHFLPHIKADDFSPTRYAKRVLLPMAEYIPFSFCQQIAAHYGINGSFTPGTHATVLQGSICPFSISICYEETFGHLMAEGRQNGSELMVNLTNDGWYPNSRLPQQHASHARLRTVESGIPLLRACNTGVTCAYDSLGRTVAMLGDGGPESEWISDALAVDLPRYHYPTIYSRTGDYVVLSFCFLALTGLIRYRKQRKG